MDHGLPSERMIADAEKSFQLRLVAWCGGMLVWCTVRHAPPVELLLYRVLETLCGCDFMGKALSGIMHVLIISEHSKRLEAELLGSP